MIRKIIGALAVCLTTFASTAQTNILEQAGINNVQWCPGAVMEEGNNYYIARYAIKSEADTFIIPLHYAPIQLSIWKYDKNTMQPVSFTVVASDTLISDSICNSYMICYNKGRIHVVFYKFILDSNNNSIMYRYYTQLDTNMNVIVPERRIPVHDQEVGLSFIAMHNDNVLYSNSYAGSVFEETINRYYIIDTLGNVVQQDTLGYPLTPNFQSTWIYDVSRYKENQYLVTGQNLLGTSQNTYIDNSFIADSAMNITDTFRNVPIGAHAEIAVLPTGSFFSSIAYNKSVYIEKHFGNRFDSSKHIQSYGIDSNDLEHPQAGIYYNNYDNKVYAVNNTHKDIYTPSGSYCALLAWPDVLPYSYTEITCLDTNLNRLWRKYIKVDFQTGGCSALLEGILPDGREGISVLGEWHNSNWNGTGADTLRQFMYYITTNTVTDSTIIGNPTAINQPTIEIRGRIKVYPNPAADMVWVDDIEGRLSEIELYDVQGRLIIKQQASGSKTSVNIATLPPGLYLIKVTMKDGEMMQKKIIKQ